MKANEWDTSYEWKAVTLLAVGFGLVGLDRWLIAPLFPSIMKDLNLTAQDVGNCIGVLGLSWGVFAALIFAGTAVMLYIFRGLGAQPLALFAVLFVASFFTLGLVSLLSGPVATEAAPVGLVSTSIGAVVGVGEIFGGGIAPAMGGYVASHFGIQNILWLPMCAVVLGILVSVLLKETAPAVLQRRSMRPELAAGE